VYVERLYKGIARNFSGEWDFTVILDEASATGEGMEMDKRLHGRYYGQPFPTPFEPHRCRLVMSELKTPPSWWHKTQLFRTDIWPEGETVFYMDLDTVIISSLDKLAEREGFNMLNWGFSFYPYNSSVMIFPAGRYPFIHDDFSMERSKLYPGDQEYTHQGILSHGVEVNGIHSNEAASYKKHKLAEGMGPHSSTSILCFHGRPRPHELDKNRWAYKEWVK
jgi:hypothetical protein